SNFDTQHFTLTVSGGIDLNSASDDGLYNDDNFTGVSAPGFTIQAAAGQTVVVSVNGAGSFATTESSPGVYSVTLPAGTLQVGDNTISAPVTGTNPQTLTPLQATFAPSAVTGAYAVP